MPHLYLSYHTFYDDDRMRRTFKGPRPDDLRAQIRSLKRYLRPAADLMDGVQNGDAVFSATIDDGSATIRDALPIFREEGVHVAISVCAVSALHREVLEIHKVNLLRLHLGDDALWARLKREFRTDFPLDEWPVRARILPEQLYRYDQPSTRRLKTALNYQLSYEQACSFVNPLFIELFGPEPAMACELYLGRDELLALRGETEILFHGRRHRVWSHLDDSAHREELDPPAELRDVLPASYFLSVPFGIDGTYQRERVRRDAGSARGALTVARRPDSGVDGAGFWWIHRYDQADIFDRQGAVRPGVLKYFGIG